MEPGGSMRVHKDSPKIPILSRMNPITRIDTYLFKIHSNIVLPSTPWPFYRSLSCRCIDDILKALLPSSILATWNAYLNLLYLITLDILGERYKLWSSSLWCLFHSPFASLLNPNIRLRILFSNTLSPCPSRNRRYPILQPYSPTGNIIVLYGLIFKFSERSREDESDWTE